jgi:exodeoxyribonuclease VII large subunit
MQKYTPTSLNEELKNVLEARYPSVFVEAEVSQVQVRNGHAYLTLRDADSQLGAVCWKSAWAGVKFQPKMGDKVLVRGRLTVYPPRGNYQLSVFTIEPVGEGDLARRLAEIRARLAADGLLDPARKRPLPRMPRVIGVVTSLEGAALQDFLVVTRRRFPATRVLVAGATVQGLTAPASVIRAVDLLLEDGRAEVIVVTRGGGSKEDLLPFHDEQLARHLAACPVPVLSAVGHQIDTSICDLVADAVAPTPSAAAERVVPDGHVLTQRVDDATGALEAALQRRLRAAAERVEGLRARLRHPGERLREQQRRRDELSRRLERAMAERLRRAGADLERTEQKLAPEAVYLLERRRAALERSAARLDALSPLAVLSRGFAIVRGKRGVVHAPDDVRPGETVEVRVRDGAFEAVVAKPGAKGQLGLF